MVGLFKTFTTEHEQNTTEMCFVSQFYNSKEWIQVKNSMRYIKSALISDELYSTDEFMAHNGNLQLTDYLKAWNNLEFGKMKCCVFVLKWMNQER